MRRIYKYPIPFHVNGVIRLPKNWGALSYQLQHGVPTLWASVDPEEDVLGYEFVWLATGDDIPYNFAYQHTFQDGAEVWHLYINTGFYV